MPFGYCTLLTANRGAALPMAISPGRLMPVTLETRQGSARPWSRAATPGCRSTGTPGSRYWPDERWAACPAAVHTAAPAQVAQRQQQRHPGGEIKGIACWRLRQRAQDGSADGSAYQAVKQGYHHAAPCCVMKRRQATSDSGQPHGWRQGALP